MHCSKGLMYINFSKQLYKLGTINSTPFLQMRKLLHQK